MTDTKCTSIPVFSVAIFIRKESIGHMLLLHKHVNMSTCQPAGYDEDPKVPDKLKSRMRVKVHEIISILLTNDYFSLVE